MQRFWQFVYSTLIIPLLWLVLRTLGLFNAKIRRGIAGRTRLFEDLERQVKALGPGKRIWFHSSSMGEFEQAKPVIAALKSRSPGVQIMVSFFSPSGYEHSRKYPHAGVITYLPFDTRGGAQKFLDLIRPDVAVMVRYDIWPNHIWELQRRGIPIMIANATMRRQTRRRIPLVRNFHHSVYNAIDNILTVTQLDVDAFGCYALDHPRIEAIGDTRYDQVRLRSAEARKHTIIPPGTLKDKRVVVIGSSWPEDEAVILPALFRLQESMENLLFIIVPHEPTLQHIEDLERELTGRASFLRFSVVNEYAGERVLIVDSIGILLILYAAAHVAYVGGSFRHGVHNVLEAAVYGVPVLFGPNHRNSQEPLMLVGQGGAFIVNDSAELERTLRNLLEDESARRTAGERAARFVESNVGATGRFLQRLEPYLAPEQPTTAYHP
jgi:3-deoxy-D-manno-octulosonic-acid transferase